jgi:cytoskeletal protein CcmA (bactofilin family)
MLNKYKSLLKGSESDLLMAAESGDSKSISDNTALIGAGVKIEGQVVSQEDLVIAGEVKGQIIAKSHHVHIAISGALKADITANVVSIEGSVTGNISGLENVIITSTGNVLGNIECPRVSLEDGAKFKGSIEMSPAEPVAAVRNVKTHLTAADSDQVDSKAS